MRERTTRVMRLVVLMILVGSSALSFAEGEGVFKNVFWQPNEVKQGSVLFFTVELDRTPRRVTGTLLGKELTFFRSSAKPQVWYALGGVDMETAPGEYVLAVRVLSAKGRVSHTSKKVNVASGEFKEGAIEVAQNFVTPDEAAKKQIALDEVLKKGAYAHVSAAAQWSGDFIKPVAAPSTPSFGMTRVLNEEMTSQHRGTDFPIKESSPVVASNAGTVVLAKDLFYEGGCVIVDHGQRFFTIYMHLSKMEVKVGERVKKEQRLGLSGATGRVTGPHLHMGVRWNGAYLDPTTLISLTLPETHKTDSLEKRSTGRSGHARRTTRGD